MIELWDSMIPPEPEGGAEFDEFMLCREVPPHVARPALQELYATRPAGIVVPESLEAPLTAQIRRFVRRAARDAEQDRNGGT